MFNKTEPFASWNHGQIDIPNTTATLVPASADTSRYELTISNFTTTTIYLGAADTVTNTTGYPIRPGEEKSFPFTSDVSVYVYQNSGGAVRIGYWEGLR